VAVVAGIDEAGYGPRLGPLVVGAVAFRVPDGARQACLWEQLDHAVCRSRRDARRVPVDDSKRLFSQQTGPRHLERAALAFAAAAEQTPATFRGLLDAVAELDEDLEDYPWYAGLDFSLPVAADPEEFGADAGRLCAGDVRFLAARCLPVLTGEFNRLCRSHGTKSAALFLKTARLLRFLWDAWGEDDLIVHVDKHGGRDYYDLLLHQAFFGARVRTLREGRGASAYEVTAQGRCLTVGFYKGADADHLPVALASIYCKYLRELFLRGFQAYWSAQAPQVRPTAGYAADARRFLEETAAIRRRLGTDESLLIRER
jgi:hypothetical protein